MLAETSISSLSASRGKFTRAQQVLAAGKRVLKPSDDPAASRAILQYRSRIASVEQYQDSISSGQSRLEVADSALEMVDKLLHEARGIAVEYPGEYDDSTRQTAADAVKDIYDQVRDMANMRYGDQYIFAGHKSDTPPVSRDDDYSYSWSGDDGDVRIAIGDGTQVSLNAGGKNPFENGAPRVFDTLKNIIDGLEAGDSSAVAGEVDALDQAIVRVRDVQGEYAATYDRLQSTRSHWQKEQMNVEALLADTENADLNEAAVELQMQQISYESALSATSKVISQTLLDFLK
jgi:flagellar hook-associated protein 3 FlgL